MKLKAILLAAVLTPALSFANTVNLTWDTPTTREDGSSMAITELGGFYIRYQCNGGAVMTDMLEDGEMVTHQIESLPNGGCNFQIATYDTAGVVGNYSDIVSIDLGDELEPGVVTNFTVTKDSDLPKNRQECVVDINCRVNVNGTWE